MIVPFGEWLPDMANFNNPGVTEAKNVIPGAGNYLPFQEVETYSTNALEGRCQGAISAKDKDGVTYNFAGDASKLYLMQSGEFSDISRTATYSTTQDSFWSFARFGEQVYASNFDDEMQFIDLTSGAFFADVGGDSPKARSIATVGDFLVALNTFDADGETPYRVRWSAIGDPTSWTVSSVTQADYQNLDSGGGNGMQIIGGEYGVILMENAIYRMDYVGSPSIFRFRQVEFARGTPAPKSAVRVGNFVAYLGQDGFYMFDGNQSMPIGANKVDKYFYNTVDLQNITRTVAAVDPQRQLIFWIYPDANNINGTPNCALVYNYSQNSTLRWSRIESISDDYMYIFLSEGYRMIDLDVPFGRMIDIIHRMNSRIFMGGDSILAGFNPVPLPNLVTYDGPARDAVMETMEAQPNDGGLSEIHVMRPLVDTNEIDSIITVQTGTRNKQGEEVTWSDPIEMNDSGEAPVRAHARYHRARVNIARNSDTGGFSGAIGVDLLQTRKAGRR